QTGRLIRRLADRKEGGTGGCYAAGHPTPNTRGLLPDTQLVGQSAVSHEPRQELSLAAAAVLSPVRRPSAVGARIRGALLRRSRCAAAHETLEMRGLQSRAHHEAGEPLAGVLGDDCIDPGKPGREACRPPMACGGQPPAAAILVAGISAAASRCRGPGVGVGTAGSAGHRGHPLAGISLPAGPAPRSPPDLCGDSGFTDVIACLLRRSPMDNEGREKVALFRFGVISPLVARKGMSWGEREELIRGIV